LAYGRGSRESVRRVLLWAGLTILVAGLIELARVPLAYWQVAYAQKNQLQQAVSVIHSQQVAKAQITEHQREGLYPPAASTGIQPKSGVLVGKMYIPKLRLEVPVRQGTSLKILSGTAGHLMTSVLPGEIGTSVMAAHDVTYFHHIDRLQAGDLIRVQTSQGQFTFRVQSHRVIHTGTNVVNTTYPSLVLETCYPLNALQLVNRRYVVRAVLIHSVLDNHPAS
jgi:sortase A